jgi:hypothetical protein
MLRIVVIPAEGYEDGYKVLTEERGRTMPGLKVMYGAKISGNNIMVHCVPMATFTLETTEKGQFAIFADRWLGEQHTRLVGYVSSICATPDTHEIEGHLAAVGAEAKKHECEATELAGPESGYAKFARGERAAVRAMKTRLGVD